MRPFIDVMQGLFLCPKICIKEDICMSTEIMSENFATEVGTDLIDVSHMYESLRYNDYSVENGLGEIVDNAVEAGQERSELILKRNQ